MEQFYFNIHFYKTGALKVIKTVPSVFTFCKVYLQYVDELYHNRGTVLFQYLFS